ncbi:aldolase, partial [Aureobasidium melanogenum]
MVHSTTLKSFPPSIHVPIVLAGTNGEAVTLSPKEKLDLVSITRKLANELGRPEVIVTLGCGGQSTRDVIAEIRLAKEVGADFALVLVPSYFHFAMNEDAIVEFFQELADASPVPILIYNFPGVVAGLDVNSDMLSKLGSHPNIVRVKLTCGGIAKLVPALAVGATGTITGVANLYLKYCIEIYNLWMQGKAKEAEKAQLKLAKIEWGFAKGGINGTKWVVAKLRGYSLDSYHCRRPYLKFVDAKKQAWVLDTVIPLREQEKTLI